MSHNHKDRLQQMDDYDFEHFVADLWERMGWSCEVSQASVDAGIDVTATKSQPYSQKKLIQAKRYGPNTSVGGPAIQQYASLKHQQPNADSVVVVTTNEFTSAAQRRADDLNVKLVDGDQLVDLINDQNAHDLVEKYLPQTTTTTGDDWSTPTTSSSQNEGPSISETVFESELWNQLSKQFTKLEPRAEWHTV